MTPDQRREAFPQIVEQLGRIYQDEGVSTDTGQVIVADPSAGSVIIPGAGGVFTPIPGTGGAGGFTPISPGQ